MAELESGALVSHWRQDRGRTTLDTVCHLYSEPGTHTSEPDGARPSCSDFCASMGDSLLPVEVQILGYRIPLGGSSQAPALRCSGVLHGSQLLRE